MSEATKRAFARKLAGGGALFAFLAVFGAGLWLGGVYWSEGAFGLAYIAAITCHLLGTMRSTKGRWI